MEEWKRIAELKLNGSKSVEGCMKEFCIYLTVVTQPLSNLLTSWNTHNRTEIGIDLRRCYDFLQKATTSYIRSCQSNQPKHIVCISSIRLRV